LEIQRGAKRLQTLLINGFTLNLFGIFMKREEAIAVLNELFGKCTFLDGHYLALMPAGYANTLSKGYQILIKTPIDEKTRSCMQDVLMKNHLTIKITAPETFVIYRPPIPEGHNSSL
jgi:hypothetical protein